MKAALGELAPQVGVAAACNALGVPRSTAQRWRQPRQYGPRRPRPTPPRALTEPERIKVLEVLHSERFVDKAPATVHATLLDDNEYFCHWRTMYRILAASSEVRERRDQVRHPKYAAPELLATAPNQVWTWDVTWLRGPVKYSYYPLYSIIDLFSRFTPGWMLAHEESGELASKLIRETCRRQGIKPGTLTIHADRGPVQAVQRDVLRHRHVGGVDADYRGVAHVVLRPTGPDPVARLQRDRPFADRRVFDRRGDLVAAIV